MVARVQPARARIELAALLGALAACSTQTHDPCEAYRAYDNVIHDAAEWTAFVDSGCTVVQGHLTLAAGSADPTSAPAVEEITGGLGISLDARYQEVALPHLRSIGGCLIVTGGNERAVHLPALSSVGQSVLVSDTPLEVIDLPALASIGGGTVRFHSNPSLRSLELPALTTPASLDVAGNLGLERLSFPALRTAGAVFVDDCPALTSVSFPALTAALGDVMLGYLPALPAVDLPALETVGGQGSFAELSLYDLRAATRISLPALRSVEATFEVSGNQALRTLTVPALDVVGALFVRANPVYPECDANALRDHLVASCDLRTALILGNDTTAICVP